MSRDTISRDKQWYELPRPAAMAKLVEVRNELRAKNLHDTEEPMTRVAELGSIVNRPWLFVIVGLVALAAWGAVTYVAVKLAIVSAAKVTRTHPS